MCDCGDCYRGEELDKVGRVRWLSEMGPWRYMVTDYVPRTRLLTP